MISHTRAADTCWRGWRCQPADALYATVCAGMRGRRQHPNGQTVRDVRTFSAQDKLRILGTADGRTPGIAQVVSGAILRRVGLASSALQLTLRCDAVQPRQAAATRSRQAGARPDPGALSRGARPLGGADHARLAGRLDDWAEMPIIGTGKVTRCWASRGRPCDRRSLTEAVVGLALAADRPPRSLACAWGVACQRPAPPLPPWPRRRAISRQRA